ncbi:MAG: HigA family addiction module antidote protein [Bacteroidales bacterium]|nr:HigA family addiction module antidote protein [Bacteroidales bacterium]
METNTEIKYLANDYTPAFPVHPGSILGEELKARGINQKKFADAVGLQATHLSALIHGKRNFTPPVASKIASGLNEIPAEIWMKLQKRYNIDIQRKSAHTSKLVFGYNQMNNDIQPACLAEPQSPFGGKLQLTLTIRKSDKALLESLAARMGWDVKL